ncbi:hypothetical protein R6242_18745 [Iodobacter sp. CM08]|uniref:hypothetical protein n=1 Tax=Iodobacter sp. CM08 TaxID=3085902 RepID=UPI002980A3B7|nr:hypothetical protein [Iodobacter sp. CM08]MDW5418607.1 hypothetical protein [Iodobacter sp. CM08]
MDSKVLKEGIKLAPIEIMVATELMLSSPVENGLMAMTEVTPIVRLDELHFILCPRDIDTGPAMFKSYESATCLQVIIAMEELCIGRMMEKIFFYASYEGSWKQIHFTEFDEKLIKKSWTECDSGDSLIGPVIKPITLAEINLSALTDDYTSPAFGYWRQACAMSNIVFSEFEDEVEDSCQLQRDFVQIGDARIEIRKYIGANFLFAIDKEVLELRIQKASEREEYVLALPFHKVADSIGWGCFYNFVDRTEQSITVIEPGELRLIYPDWHEYASKIRNIGGQIIEISPNIVEAILVTELDMTQPSGGPCVLLKRGRYRLELM